MTRPPSIVTFERCYLGAWLLGIVNLALTWNAHLVALDTPQAEASFGLAGLAYVLVGGIVLGSIVTLVLWWFTARRASVVAKWIVVVFCVIGFLSLLSGLARGTGEGGIGGILTVVGWVLQVIAVVMLFRPDAKAWFGERPTAGL